MAAAFFIPRKDYLMDFSNLLSDLMSHIPEEVKLNFDFPAIQDIIPFRPDILSTLKSLAVFAVVFVLLGIVGRVFCGRRSNLNHALSSSIGILLIYALTACLYTLKPLSLDAFISPLPFVAFSGEYMRLFPLAGAHFSVVCYEILGMLILAFLMNLFDTLLYKGDGIIGWYLLRFLSVALAMVSHILVNWLLAAYLPDVLSLNAPVILLCVLAVFLLLGIANFILGLVLTATNPILGAIYTFFFSTLVGKQLSKAVLTTIVLTVLVFILNQIGFGLVLITEAALITYIPAIAVLLVLWYLVGHIL